MSDTGAIRDLYPKPRAVSYSTGRPVLMLRDSQTVDPYKQTYDQNIDPVAPVFGTQQPRELTTDAMINRTVVLPQLAANFVAGAVIGWTEEQNNTLVLVLLDIASVSSGFRNIEMITLYRDSIFPVLMTSDCLPINTTPSSYRNGIYLELLISKEKQRSQRTVRFIDYKDIAAPVVTCSTYAASLYLSVCSSRTDKTKVNIHRYIARVIDMYRQSHSVCGLYAPYNMPIGERIAQDCTDDPTGVSTGPSLSNRYVFLVANDALLAVTEFGSDKSFFTSLLKTDSFCICEGTISIATGIKDEFKNLVPKSSFYPYYQLLVIVAEGVNDIQISRRDLTKDVGKTMTFVSGYFRLSDLSTNIVSMDWAQVCQDVEPHGIVLPATVCPLMPLTAITDALIIGHKNKQDIIGYILFSLTDNYITDKNFVDFYNVFICLDDSRYSDPNTIYQYMLTAEIRYNFDRDGKHLGRPFIYLYDTNHPIFPIPQLTSKQDYKWKAGGKFSLPAFKFKNNYQNIYLPQINQKVLKQFHNVGPNLVLRYNRINENGIIFPDPKLTKPFGQKK